jgi:hypothetical protein
LGEGRQGANAPNGTAAFPTSPDRIKGPTRIAALLSNSHAALYHTAPDLSRAVPRASLNGTAFHLIIIIFLMRMAAVFFPDGENFI